MDTDKLDNLVDLTGELVIAQSMFKQIGLEVAADNQKYFQNLNQVTQAVSSIQKIAMSMRMVPIKNTFQKMFRLVRDLARNQGKEVDLTMTGEDTEIDRNVVDELYEPLVHMIRNGNHRQVQECRHDVTELSEPVILNSNSNTAIANGWNDNEWDAG